MKKTILVSILFLLITSFQINKALAISKQTPTPTTIDLQQQVNELKNKIASKVAELNLVEKRGIYGTVTDSSDTQITLKDLNDNTRFVDVDELTKFSSSSLATFGISDIKKGMVLGVLGIYNKESERIQARVVEEEDPLPNFIYGAVFSTDSTNYTLTVAKENGAKNLVNIETVTKTYSYSAGDLVKAGFSKIKNGETVIAVGFFDKQNKNEIIGSRVLLFPSITASSRINLNPDEPTIVPSTGSGVKLQPIAH